MFSSDGSWGGLIPLWILGAPFIGAIISLMTTPRGRSREQGHDPRNDSRHDRNVDRTPASASVR